MSQLSALDKTKERLNYLGRFCSRRNRVDELISADDGSPSFILRAMFHAESLLQFEGVTLNSIFKTERLHGRNLLRGRLGLRNYLLSSIYNRDIACEQESPQHAFKRVLQGSKIFYVRHDGKFVAGISTDAQTGDYVFDPNFQDCHSNKDPSFLLRRCGERFTDQKDQRQVFRIIGSSFIQDIAEWWEFDQEVILL